MQDKNKVAQIKQTTIQKIDNYTKLKTFKELSKDKQEAILYLKEINPAPMPEGVSKENLENLFRHFENKQDENARRYYSKLFDDTKQHADFILDTKGKEGQARKEYIKAYQHKSTHDLYYMIVTENNDKVNVTAHPITEIREMIRHKSERASVIKDSNQAPA